MKKPLQVVGNKAVTTLSDNMAHLYLLTNLDDCEDAAGPLPARLHLVGTGSVGFQAAELEHVDEPLRAQLGQLGAMQLSARKLFPRCFLAV
jgi:hypothetical protein